MKKSTTKKLVWFVIGNAVAWVWCSYLLAFLGREEIAQELSQSAVTTIIGVVLMYCLKALFEKRPDFGSIGVKDNSELGC